MNTPRKTPQAKNQISVNAQGHVTRIVVVGVGGGGVNAVNNMVASGLSGVEFIAANTDAQSLQICQAQHVVQLGPHLTQGLGAGARPEIGRAAAEEAIEELGKILSGAHLVFVAAGMGGGTGTGAAPVVARVAKESGALTVGVVTRPFQFEGAKRQRSAELGIEELSKVTDTLIVVPNQNLFRVASEKTSLVEAFRKSDDVLLMGVRGVTDLIVNPGIVNLDFADIRTVMSTMGRAMMGAGEANGEDRALRAAEAAISNPLLEDTTLRGAQGVLINITGGLDMTLFEVDAAASRVRKEIDDEVNVIFGSCIDERMNGRIRVSVVATGLHAAPAANTEPQRPRLVAVAGVPVSEAAAEPSATTLSVVTTEMPAPPRHSGFSQPAFPAAAQEHVFQAAAPESPPAPLWRAVEDPLAAQATADQYQAPSPSSSPKSFLSGLGALLRRPAQPTTESPALPPRTQPRGVEPDLDIPTFIRRGG